MSEVIYPRSPRETMDGWFHLPRFVDKIRLHLAGRLAPDYQDNFTKGFDGAWLNAAGITADEIIAIVKGSICDGQVCDWVRRNVRKTAAEKNKFNESVSNHGRTGDDLQARLKMRKEQAGMANRADVQCFFDFIDADEKRI